MSCKPRVRKAAASDPREWDTSTGWCLHHLLSWCHRHDPEPSLITKTLREWQLLLIPEQKQSAYCVLSE